MRRFGAEHAFAFAIDDSDLELLSADEQKVSTEASERFSPREELIALADEWIAAAPTTGEKGTHATREELLAAMDEIRSKP